MKYTKKQGRPLLMTGPLLSLITKIGSLEKAAQLLGVTTRTVQRWDSKEVSPSGSARRLLAILARKHGLPPPFVVDYGDD